VAAKVVSVGNITIGGSGKTPMVIYLANLLKSKGKKVGVLSRGYGRTTKGYLLVSDGEKIFTTVNQCGDEIFQTVEECNVPAAVAERRVAGAQKFISDTGVKIIILDDAFQHRWIERNLDLLIFEQRFLFRPDAFSHMMLPAGLMREPFDSTKRADAIIINRKFSDAADIPDWLKKYFRNKNIFTAHYSAIGFVDVVRKTFYDIEEFKEQKSLVVSGIANPHSFLNALKKTKVDTENRIIFRDHKHYTLKEVQKIRKEFYATNSYSVVTTHKDAVKLSEYSKELDDIDIFYLKIKLEMDNEESFKKFLLERID
jgi:tetraacyldisaccharide 4'-kinase